MQDIDMSLSEMWHCMLQDSSMLGLDGVENLGTHMWEGAGTAAWSGLGPP